MSAPEPIYPRRHEATIVEAGSGDDFAPLKKEDDPSTKPLPGTKRYESAFDYIEDMIEKEKKALAEGRKEDAKKISDGVRTLIEMGRVQAETRKDTALIARLDNYKKSLDELEGTTFTA